MKIADAFRISIHTMRHNAGRTALTALIVAIVSTLVMFLMTLGTAFSQNASNAGRTYFASTGASYFLDAYSGSDDERYRVTPEEYHAFRTIAEKYADVCGDDTVDCYNTLTLFSGDFNSFDRLDENDGWGFRPSALYGKSFSSVASDIRVREGRIWTPEDRDGDAIFFPRRLQRAVEQIGYHLEVGDEVLLLDLERDKIVKTFTVAGILEDTESFTDHYRSAISCFIGSDTLCALVENGYGTLDWISMEFRPPLGNYDYPALFDRMQAFVEEVNAAMRQETFDGSPALGALYDLIIGRSVRFQCGYVTAMQVIDILSGIVIAVFFLLALLVLLLSVGSVANSVVISIDKNKKFFGMMKAVGLDAKGIRALVCIELLLIVLAGVFAGMVLLFLLKPLAYQIISSLFGYLLGSFMTYTATVSVPLWLPAATVAFFLVLTLLFSLGSIRKIAAQDVMATLSEVT